jgi:CheY-like chemotaxis protein
MLLFACTGQYYPIYWQSVQKLLIFAAGCCSAFLLKPFLLRVICLSTRLQNLEDWMLPANEKPLILLTEDDESIAFLVQKQLEGCAHVHVASAVDEALDKANSQRYDAFLIDINLGFGQSGVDLLNALREHPTYGDAPIATLTAYSMTGDRERFLREGFDYYISKPFTKSELRLLVASMTSSGGCN